MYLYRHIFSVLKEITRELSQLTKRLQDRFYFISCFYFLFSILYYLFSIFFLTQQQFFFCSIFLYFFYTEGKTNMSKHVVIVLVSFFCDHKKKKQGCIRTSTITIEFGIPSVYPFEGILFFFVSLSFSCLFPCLFCRPLKDTLLFVFIL